MLARCSHCKNKLLQGVKMKIPPYYKKSWFQRLIEWLLVAKRGIDMSFKAISNLIGIHSKLRVFGLFSPFNNPSFKPYNLGA